VVQFEGQRGEDRVDLGIKIGKNLVRTRGYIQVFEAILHLTQTIGTRCWLVGSTMGYVHVIELEVFLTRCCSIIIHPEDIQITLPHQQRPPQHLRQFTRNPTNDQPFYLLIISILIQHSKSCATTSPSRLGSKEDLLPLFAAKRGK
jgi:hypothetical protein